MSFPTTRQGDVFPKPDYCDVLSERVVGGANATPPLSENRMAVASDRPALYTRWIGIKQESARLGPVHGLPILEIPLLEEGLGPWVVADQVEVRRTPIYGILGLCSS